MADTPRPMSELLNETMRPDLYEQLPVDLQIMSDGLEAMTSKCEELQERLRLAEDTAKDYRDKYCATIISKNEKLPWE
jgi:hypothetical protein